MRFTSKILLGFTVVYFLGAGYKIHTLASVIPPSLPILLENKSLPTLTEIFSHRVPTHQLECLAQNIYFEARNESVLGQFAVAWVTMNRVDSQLYPNNICDVVWEKKQFSWTHDGKSDKILEKEAYEKAKEIAKTTLQYHLYGFDFDPTYGAILYHAEYVNPRWSKSYNLVADIGSHSFYK